MAEFIYHEKQSAALCGVHCLNNLLQGPYTTAGALAEVAHELDAQERALMMSAGVDTPEAIRYAASESINVDASGNFSITVLRTALQNSHNLQLERRLASNQQDPSTADVSFILFFLFFFLSDIVAKTIRPHTTSRLEYPVTHSQSSFSFFSFFSIFLLLNTHYQPIYTLLSHL